MSKISLPLSQVYRLLEPGPVVLLSTQLRGKSNIMTMSWHTMLEFEPPLVGCVVSNRDFTFNILKSTKECVINIPTTKISKAVVGCGNTSGKSVDKFKRYKLTAVPAEKVKAPLIEQCYANLECRLIDLQLEEKYNFFVLEVIKAWIDPVIKNPKTMHHRGNGLFMIAGRSLQTTSKMK